MRYYGACVGQRRAREHNQRGAALASRIAAEWTGNIELVGLYPFEPPSSLWQYQMRAETVVDGERLIMLFSLSDDMVEDSAFPAKHWALRTLAESIASAQSGKSEEGL